MEHCCAAAGNPPGMHPGDVQHLRPPRHPQPLLGLIPPQICSYWGAKADPVAGSVPPARHGQALSEQQGGRCHSQGFWDDMAPREGTALEPSTPGARGPWQDLGLDPGGCRPLLPPCRCSADQPSAEGCDTWHRAAVAGDSPEQLGKPLQSTSEPLAPPQTTVTPPPVPQPPPPPLPARGTREGSVPCLPPAKPMSPRCGTGH